MFRFLLENKKQNNQEYVCTYIVSFSILKISVNYVKKNLFITSNLKKSVYVILDTATSTSNEAPSDLQNLFYK